MSKLQSFQGEVYHSINVLKWGSIVQRAFGRALDHWSNVGANQTNGRESRLQISSNSASFFGNDGTPTQDLTILTQHTRHCQFNRVSF